MEEPFYMGGKVRGAHTFGHVAYFCPGHEGFGELRQRTSRGVQEVRNDEGARASRAPEDPGRGGQEERRGALRRDEEEARRSPENQSSCTFQHGFTVPLSQR